MGAFAAVAQGSHNPRPADRPALRPAGREGRRRPRARRQGDHVRHGRHLAQAGGVHGGHEGRHVRRRGRHRGDRRDRRPRPAPARDRRRRRDREHRPAAARSGPATSSPRATARRSRSRTPTPRDGSSSPTPSGTRASSGATHLVDLATLTGRDGGRSATSTRACFANDEDWRDEIIAAGEASGDHAWPMPMHRRYRRLLDSKFADMKNSSMRGQARAGATRRGSSRSSSAKGRGRTWTSPARLLPWAADDYLSQTGGTGYGVRLIVELASSLSA